MSKGTILLVEDNAEILKANTWMLTQEGYSVQQATSIKEAQRSLNTSLPDLIVLDILLPDGSGLTLCEELRRQANVPILFLTALGKSSDVVKGLRAGGDDYLAKPYEYEVLLARIEALLRRSPLQMTTLERGALKLEIPSMRVYVNGRDALLTQKEFLVLLTLVQREGEVVTPDELYRAAWGESAATGTHAVRPQVSRLRSKLEAESDASFSITSEYGRGYVFRQE